MIVKRHAYLTTAGPDQTAGALYPEPGRDR